jgi:hypothetical protein
MDHENPERGTSLDTVTTVTEDTLLALPAELIDDASFGLATLADIFVKHGYSAETAEAFRKDVRFQRLVRLREGELTKEGITPRMRDGALADASRTALLRRVSEPSTPASVLLDVYKASSRLAGREPVGAQAGATGPGAGFSININFPSTGAQQATIDITPERVVPAQPFNPAEFEVV